jgi:site-specific DNA-cytosine methylase
LLEDFPCQSFSIAGKRGGFEDTRGTLFFEIARIIKQKQPRLLLLENVKGLLSHDKGKRSLPSSPRLMNWGMTVNGKCLTAKISESHRTGKECSLSDILEEQVDQKYFLSDKASQTTGHNKEYYQKQIQRYTL